MTAPEKAVEWAVAIANDPTHGYDQSSRWGNDYDCSSLVISAYETAGIPVRRAGATYTGNMRVIFKNCGFYEVTDGTLKPGDVLLNEKHHTAMYIGDDKIVQASINEKGTVTGGLSGDQTGGEIAVKNYYSYPWDCVLRYGGCEEQNGDGPVTNPQPRPVPAVSASVPLLREGAISNAVKSAQILLIYRWRIYCGPDGADGDFGANTKKAVIQFQQKMSIDADGIIGTDTWTKLIN